MKKISKLLEHAEYQLGALQFQAEKLDNLSVALRHFLPETWAEQCSVTQFDDQKILTISTTQQALVTLLRFMLPQLMQQLKQVPAFRGIKGIQCVYSPPIGVSLVDYPQPTVTKTAINACKDAIESCPQSIQRALKKLVDTLQKKL